MILPTSYFTIGTFDVYRNGITNQMVFNIKCLSILIAKYIVYNMKLLIFLRNDFTNSIVYNVIP